MVVAVALVGCSVVEQGVAVVAVGEAGVVVALVFALEAAVAGSYCP